LSNYQYAATPKFDLGYRSHPSSNTPVWSVPETKAIPPQSDLPDRSSNVLGNSTPQSRHLYELESSVSPPNYSIYPSTAKDIYIYERSLCSKSDTYTETTSSPSSCFSTALSNDSTATLQSTAPTPSLVSDSSDGPSPPVPPSARSLFPYQISPVDYAFSTPRNSHTESAVSAPMVRSLTADPIIRLPVSSVDETSASTEIIGSHSSTLTDSSFLSSSHEESVSFGGPRFTSAMNVPPLQNTQVKREPSGIGIFPANQSNQPGSGGNYRPYYSPRDGGNFTAPSPPHRARPSSAYFSSPQDNYLTSATRGYSPPRETSQNMHESRTGFFPSLPEARYPDGYSANPPRVDPVPSGGRDAYIPTTSRASGHQGGSSPTARVRRDADPPSGVNPSVRNPVDYRPETPYPPPGRQLNDIPPPPRRAGDIYMPAVTPADTFLDSTSRGQTEKSDRSHLNSRIRRSAAGQSSRALPSPPRARGETNSMAGERDVLDLAERGESPATQGKRDSRHGDSLPLGEVTAVTNEYRGGYPRQPTKRDSGVQQSFRGPQTSPTSLTVDHHFPTGHISTREDALDMEGMEPYPSTTLRSFADRTEPLPSTQSRRDPDGRDSSSRAHSQPMRNYMDYELVPHYHERWDSDERQDSRVPSAPLAASSGTKPLTFRRGEANNTAGRDMYASTPRALTSRQENSQGMQSLQDVDSRHSAAGPQVARNDVTCNALPSRGPSRRNSDERQETRNIAMPSQTRATYLNDTGADTDINRQPPPSQNKSRSVPPLRDISSVQHNSRSALQASDPQRISEGHRSAPAGIRCVRWDKDLIAPSPIQPSQRRKGWFNRRGYVSS
jgi:hypothetical protein